LDRIGVALAHATILTNVTALVGTLRLDSRQHPMRRIGLAVVLLLSLLSPLAVNAQPSGKVYRIGI